MWKFTKRGVQQIAFTLFLAGVVVACVSSTTPPATGSTPTPMETAMLLASSTSSPKPSLAPTFTAEPTLPPAEPTPDLSWLTPQPLTDIAWKSYRGHIEDKAVTFDYQVGYPADWYLYPEGMMVQTFPPFDGLTPEPPGFKEGYMKVDVTFEPCEGEVGKCQLAGTPVSVAGLPAVAGAYPDEVVPGLQIRTVAVPYANTVLRVTAFMRGDAERIKHYEQIFGYMVSTLKFDP